MDCKSALSTVETDSRFHYPNTAYLTHLESHNILHFAGQTVLSVLLLSKSALSSLLGDFAFLSHTRTFEIVCLLVYFLNDWSPSLHGLLSPFHRYHGSTLSWINAGYAVC